MPNTGALIAGTAVSSTEDNQSPRAWQNPSNATADDNTYASITSGVGVTQWLKATSFGASVPTDATITGVLPSAALYASGSGVTVHKVQLVKGGSFAGTAKTPATSVGTSESTLEWGASDDLWGTTWTPTEVNASGFGFGISTTNTGSPRSHYADAMWIIVHYTTASGVPERMVIGPV
jgi:hypothetical protein